MLDYKYVAEFYQEDFDRFSQKLNGFLNSEKQYFLPQKNGTKKDILFLGATHGDEKIGVDVLSSLPLDNRLDWLIANEKALAENKRFIDADMNRNAPGTLDSAHYEVRRAYELVGQFKNYNYVIDIHGSVSNCGIFIILTKLSFDDLLLALQLDIPNIVIWLPSQKKEVGPLVQFAEPAIEIECGPKDCEKLRMELKDILEKFITNYDKGIDKTKLKNKKIFWVYGKMVDNKTPLVDFEKTTIDGEEFYPLLVGEYGIGCYKMKQLFDDSLISR